MQRLLRYTARSTQVGAKKVGALLTLCLLLSALSLATRVAGDTGPVQEWITRYSGPANTSITASRQVVDAAGNVSVYVTGTTPASNGHTDIVTTKYNGATGEQLWTTRYDGTASGDDSPVGLAVDGNGDVIVAGASASLYTMPPVTSTFTDVEYATIKYNGATGEQVWVAHFRYDWAFSDSVPIALAIDGSGNPFVTGHVRYRGSAATVKYDGATGQQLFAAQYNGGAAADNLYNTPVGLAVNGDGDFYLIATQEWQDPRFGRRWTYTDTVKYSGATGQRLWARGNPSSYQGQTRVSALTLDGAGNAIVTGSIQPLNSSDSQMFIVKYSSGGGQLWMNLYGSPAEFPYSVDADASGNVFASFASGMVVKYDANSGAKLWQTIATGYPAFLAVDGSGNLYLKGRVGSGGGIPVIAKYEGGTGQNVWQTAYSGNEIAAFTLDSAGSIYLTEYSTGAGGGVDYVTTKYLQNTPTLTEVVVIGITTTRACLQRWCVSG